MKNSLSARIGQWFLARAGVDAIFLEPADSAIIFRSEDAGIQPVFSNVQEHNATFGLYSAYMCVEMMTDPELSKATTLKLNKKIGPEFEAAFDTLQAARAAITPEVDNSSVAS